MLYNIYFSPTGGTKKVADILAGNLGKEVCEVDICCDIEKMTLQSDDVCLVSVPSFAGRVPQIAVERLKKISGNGAKAILNCVYGNREWDDTLTELQDTLVSCGFVCVAAVAAVAEHSIFRQFATGRPDKDDAKELAEFVLPVVRWERSTKLIPARPIKTAVSVVCVVNTFAPNTPATLIPFSCKPPPK